MHSNLSEGTAMLTKMIYGSAAIVSALALSTALSGCNTMTGVGKDVEAGGRKIQEESKDVQHKM